MNKIESDLIKDNNRLRLENELMNVKIQHTSDFLEWLVDIYINDGVKINDNEEILITKKKCERYREREHKPFGWRVN